MTDAIVSPSPRPQPPRPTLEELTSPARPRELLSADAVQVAGAGVSRNADGRFLPTTPSSQVRPNADVCVCV
jgi:hypothetical protein